MNRTSEEWASTRIIGATYLVAELRVELDLAREDIAEQAAIIEQQKTRIKELEIPDCYQQVDDDECRDPEEFLRDDHIYNEPVQFRPFKDLSYRWCVFTPTEFEDGVWDKYASEGEYREFDTKKDAEAFCAALQQKERGQ